MSPVMFLMKMFKLIFVGGFKLGIGWLVVGIAVSMALPQYEFPAIFLGIVGTILTFANRFLSKKLGYKCNVITYLIKNAIDKRKLNVTPGNESSLPEVTEPEGIIFARNNEKQTYYIQDEDAPNSVAIFGTPGSGKSQGTIIPTLLSYGSKYVNRPTEEQPSLFVVDVKGELLQKTYNYRHNVMNRKIKYLSFGDRIIPEEKSCVYDPFSIMDFVENDVQGITEIVNSLIVMRPDEKQPHFPTEARSLLTGLLYCMYKKGLSFVDALREVCSKPIDKLIETYCIGSGSTDTPENQKGWMLLSSFYDAAKSGNNNEFRSVLSTMLNPLRTLVTNDNIINAFDPKYGSQLKPTDILEGDVYLCIKEQYLDADMPNILNLIVNQYLSFFSRAEHGTSKRILCVLDEFPRLGQLKKIFEGINLYRSNGIRFMLCAQSIEQLKEKYGEHGFNGLMDAMGTTIILRAVGTSAEYFSRRIGRYDKLVESKSKGFNSQITNMFSQGINSGTSVSEQERDIFRPSFFENELQSNQKLMIIAQDGYKVADVCFAYNDKTFSTRMG